MPGNDNGSPILRYNIYSSENAETLFTYIGSSTETIYTVNNLTMGNNYRFKVVAVNFAGQGPYSTESNLRYCYVPELIQFQYMSYPVIGIPPSFGFIQLI